MLYYISDEKLEEQSETMLRALVKLLKDNNYTHNGDKIGSRQEKFIVNWYEGFVLDTTRKSIWFTQGYTDDCDNVYLQTEYGRAYDYETVVNVCTLFDIIKGDATVYNKFGEGTEVDIQALAKLYDERDKLQNQLDVTNENIENIEKSLLNYLRK